MKERPGVMLYFENRECIEALSDDEAGKLMKATLQYAQTGENPQFEGVLNLVWLLLRPVIDRDAQRYRTQCLTKTYAVYCREQDKKGEDRLSFDDWCLSNGSGDTFCYPTTTTATTTTPTTTPTTSTATATTTSSTAATAAAPTVDAAPSVFTSTDQVNRLGAHGKVLLTNKDFFTLRDEYGQAEMIDLAWKAEALAEQRGYDTDTLNWPDFLRYCHQSGRI